MADNIYEQWHIDYITRLTLVIFVIGLSNFHDMNSNMRRLPVCRRQCAGNGRFSEAVTQSNEEMKVSKCCVSTWDPNDLENCIILKIY